VARIGQRPAVKEAVEAEGLVPFGPGGIFYGPRAAVAQFKPEPAEARV
jgi:hypothetical protein